MIAQVVEKLTQEYDGKVKFAKVKIDFNSQTATDYGKRGILTLLVFKDGEPVKQIVGDVSKSVLKYALEKVTA